MKEREPENKIYLSIYVSMNLNVNYYPGAKLKAENERVSLLKKLYLTVNECHLRRNK